MYEKCLVQGLEQRKCPTNVSYIYYFYSSSYDQSHSRNYQESIRNHQDS